MIIIRSSDDRNYYSVHLVCAPLRVYDDLSKDEFSPVDNRLRVWLHVIAAVQLFLRYYYYIGIRYAKITKYVDSNWVRDDVLTFRTVPMFDHYRGNQNQYLHRYWWYYALGLRYTMAAKIQPFDPPSSASSDR